MNIFNKKIICLMLVGFLLFSSTTVALKVSGQSSQDTDIIKSIKKETGLLLSHGLLSSHIYNRADVDTDGDGYPDSVDLDPLVNLSVTVTIKEIRAYDKIDKFSDPDFYVKVFINNKEYKSPIWYNQKYVKKPWSVTVDVPDDQEIVNIRIELWDWNAGFDKLCDIAKNNASKGDNRYVDLIYSLKSGHWTGGDSITQNSTTIDESGYGRLNGCDDNSINQNDGDCELLFNINQSDYDGDGIPYWTEVNVFKTDPTVNDTGRDDDHDGVPIEWEFKWGYRMSWGHDGNLTHSWVYDPFKWEDHKHFDSDRDGLDNVEEYLTSQWGSDPFRKDIFLELDQMAIGPNGEGSFVPELSKEMLRDAFGKHNIVLHIDDGSMGGGEIIPFDYTTTFNDIRGMYYNYFLHGNYDNWRQGVFHYGIVVYDDPNGIKGFAFNGGDPSYPYVDSFLISTKYLQNMTKNPLTLYLGSKGKIPYNEVRPHMYASTMMHETGHVLGIYNGNTPGCDNRDTYNWKMPGWWKWANYKSCMNYRYVFQILDYSDGSHGKNDFDDWARMDLRSFQGSY